MNSVSIVKDFNFKKIYIDFQEISSLMVKYIKLKIYVLKFLKFNNFIFIF